jgi:hypothetical protein
MMAATGSTSLTHHCHSKTNNKVIPSIGDTDDD